MKEGVEATYVGAVIAAGDIPQFKKTRSGVCLLIKRPFMSQRTHKVTT